MQPCAQCAPLHCPGWETLPVGFDERRLRPLGTLRSPEPEPTWEEHHPAGTRTWSPDAPISPRHHPCNRSDLAACTQCGRLFLRYTETGGYYVDHRIRAVDAALVVD